MWALQEKQKKHLQGVENATIILIIGHVISSKAIATGKEEVLCPHSLQFSLLNRGLPLGGGGGGVGGLGSSGAAASGTSPDMEQARLSEQLNHRTSLI